MDNFESPLREYDIEDTPTIIFFGTNKTNPTEYNLVGFPQEAIVKAAKTEITKMEYFQQLLKLSQKSPKPWRMGEFSFWAIFLIGFGCIFIMCLFSGLAILMRKSTVTKKSGRRSGRATVNP